VLSDDGSTVAFRTLQTLYLPSTVLYGVDFSALANNTLTNGTEVIDGRNWTVANAGLLGTFEILNGTGLRMINGTSTGTGATYNATTRNTPNLVVPLSAFSWDGRYGIIIELYVSSRTLEQNGDFVFVGLHGGNAVPNSGSTERVRIASFRNSSGTIVFSETHGSTNTNTAVPGTSNVLGLNISGNGNGVALQGTYSAGFPSTMAAMYQFVDDSQPQNPFTHPDIELVIGLGVVNDASPTTQAVIPRMRILRAA